MQRNSIVVLMLGIQLSFGAWAVTAMTSDSGGVNSTGNYSAEDKLLRQKAKARAYPGGSDEEPLKVLSQMPASTRKMQPAHEPVEVSEEPEHRTNDSND